MNQRVSCHCGAVQIDVTIRAPLSEAYTCDCSLCRRKGAAMIAVHEDDLQVVQGADNLSLYQWNTMTAEHYFCKTCGIYTHHRRRVNPDEFGINTGAIDDLDPSTVGTPHRFDGNFHPSDD